MPNTVPAVLRPLYPLRFAHLRPPPAREMAMAPGSIADLTIEGQLGSNTCWAAVAQCLLGSLGYKIDQCRIVGRFMDAECCGADYGDNDRCNGTYELQAVLHCCGAHEDTIDGGDAPETVMQALRDSIARQRPLGVKAEFDETLHAIAIVGVSTEGLLTVLDPAGSGTRYQCVRLAGGRIRLGHRPGTIEKIYLVKPPDRFDRCFGTAGAIASGGADGAHG